jgi:protein TonB
MAKVARIGGEVQVEIVVDEEGNVVSARAVSGHPLLKDAAVQAASRWKFEPFIMNGNPSKVVGMIKLTF